MHRSRITVIGSLTAVRLPLPIISMRRGSPPFGGSFSSAILSPVNSPFRFE